ncbi:MAG: hypothetical protein KKH72_08480 [Alphaproteobacteria bacterium]|nr:hypothetical protein [Alphaproteobacteria bacterium]
MSRRRRRNSGTGGQIAAIAILAVVLVTVLACIFWFWIRANDAFVAIDEETLCPKQGIAAQTIVLLDTTDALSRVTQSEVLNRLNDLTASLPRGGYLDIRVLNENPDLTASILSLCNPGAGGDIDPLIGNPELAGKRWAERFAGPVAEALAASVSGGAQNFSPILAALQQIAAERLSTKEQQAVETRIVVVSDMLEHTGYYSHFRDGRSIATYRDIAGSRYLTDLHGAEIDFWMVMRDRPDIDVTELAEFWLQWADMSKGRGHVVRLMGM